MRRCGKSEHLAVAGRLVATLAHEVNNPLEALGNLLYLVENSATLEEAHSFGQLALKEFQRISEIVDHTLRFQSRSGQARFYRCVGTGNVGSYAVSREAA